MFVGQLLRTASVLSLLLAAGPSFAAAVTSSQGLFTNSGPTNAAHPDNAMDVWFATNVRGGGLGVIQSSAYAGDGSISSHRRGRNARGDAEESSADPDGLPPFPFGGSSYRWYRVPSGTASRPALRLVVADPQGRGGYRVYELVRDGRPGAPEGAWTLVDIFGAAEGAHLRANGSLLGALSFGGWYSQTAATVPIVSGIHAGTGLGQDASFQGVVITHSPPAPIIRPGPTGPGTAAVAVPEPASLGLFGLGLAALGLIRRRVAALPSGLR